MTTCLEHLNRDHQEAGVGTILNEGLQKNQSEGGRFMENAAAEMWRPHQPGRQHQSRCFFCCYSLTVWFGRKKKVLLLLSEIALLIYGEEEKWIRRV